MSDIIYTPPASGGGGTTINPTNNFIPVRSNATTFVDSCLWQVNADALRTVFAGTVNGLDIDHSNRIYALGQFALENQTYIAVNDFVSTIISYSQGSAFGFVIDRANRNMLFGDNTLNYLFINAPTQTMDFVVNGAGFAQLDGSNNVGFYGGTACNFRFDANNYKSSIGDYNGNNNSTYVLVDDNQQEITLRTQLLILDNTSTSTSASGPSPLGHLLVTINGTPCKIQLLNP